MSKPPICRKWEISPLFVTCVSIEPVLVSLPIHFMVDLMVEDRIPVIEDILKDVVTSDFNDWLFKYDSCNTLPSFIISNDVCWGGGFSLRGLAKQTGAEMMRHTAKRRQRWARRQKSNSSGLPRMSSSVEFALDEEAEGTLAIFTCYLIFNLSDTLGVLSRI